MDETLTSRARRVDVLNQEGLERLRSPSPHLRTSKTPRNALRNFIIPSVFQIKLKHRSDVSAKRKFQVNLPTRLLCILGFVFLIIPVLIFLQKEAHIHEHHDEAHYKPQKHVNVNRETAMHFLDHQNDTASNNDEKEITAPPRDEGVVKGMPDEFRTAQDIPREPLASHNITELPMINQDIAQSHNLNSSHTETRKRRQRRLRR